MSNEYNHENVVALCAEASEAQRNMREFLALAVKREKQGLPLAAQAARESAESWRKKQDNCAAAIGEEIAKL